MLKVVYVSSGKLKYLTLLVGIKTLKYIIRLENCYLGNRIVWKPVRSQHLDTRGRMLISDLLKKIIKRKVIVNIYQVDSFRI